MSKRWYVLHVYSGFEQKISDAIQEQAQKQGLQDFFGDILVPTEEVVEVRKGQRVNAERKFFPGYVLIQMEMDDRAWHLVRNVPKVTGFLGGGKKPIPMTEKEAQQLIKQLQEGVDRPRPSVTYDIGRS